MQEQWENLSRGALGMFFLILVCYILSNNRRAISWKLVLIGIFAQIMFAMGVLHTMFLGQPVFWMMFGVILLFTIVRKINKASSGLAPVTYDTRDLLLSVVWQALFIGGLILAERLFKDWSNLAICVSSIGVIAIAFKMGARYPELTKWNILFSSAILTVCIYTKMCPPEIFKIVLQSASSVFVDLINISHRGTEFLFGSLADASQSWAYIFAIQVLPNIIFFAALSAILFYLGILQKIVYVFAYLLNKLNISGAESLSTAANIFLGANRSTAHDPTIP